MTNGFALNHDKSLQICEKCQAKKRQDSERCNSIGLLQFDTF